MFPRLNINKIRQDEESSRKVPVIPPKPMYFDLEVTTDTDADAKWFIVQTPREFRGVGGPYTVEALRKMYLVGDIDDGTLVWEEGLENWKPIRTCDFLRSKLIQIPPIPLRSNQIKNEDMISPLEVAKLIKEAGLHNLTDCRSDFYCNTCGSIAVTNIPEVGEQNPNIGILASSGGSTDLATEILPGFLWIGNFASSKANSLSKLKFTLAINCTSELPNIQEAPNICRMKTFPLHDKPSKERPKDMELMTHRITQACNWIDYERLYPNRIKVLKDGKPSSPTEVGTSNYPSLTSSKKAVSTRILLWSKTGFDRACFLAAAYILRRFGLSLTRALEIVKQARPQMQLCPFYQNVLELWSKAYSFGKLMCYDCLHMAYEAEDEKHTRRALEDKQVYEELDKAISNIAEFKSLGDSRLFLSKVLTGFDLSSRWSGLCDLIVPGRLLGTAAVIKLLEILQDMSLLRRLREIDFSSNALSDAAVTRMCELIASHDQRSLPVIPLNNKPKLFRPSELTILNLAHNMLGLKCVDGLAEFLRFSLLMTLDISHNPIEDQGCAAVLLALVRPHATFFSEHTPKFSPTSPAPRVVSAAATYDPLRYNNSLTSLNMSNTGAGEASIAALMKGLKDNVTLTSLDLGMNPGLQPKALKQLFSACASSGTSLQRLCLAGTPLSVRAAESLFRLLFRTEGIENVRKTSVQSIGMPCGEWPASPSRKLIENPRSPFHNFRESSTFLSEDKVNDSSLDAVRAHSLVYFELSSCSMTATHLEIISSLEPSVCTAKSLNLSLNHIGDEGASHLAQLILSCAPSGSSTSVVAVCLLQRLDLVGCGIGFSGFANIMRALRQLPYLASLDFSGNCIDPSALTGVQTSMQTSTFSDSLSEIPTLTTLFASTVQHCAIHSWKMNDCHLSSKFAVALFDAIAGVLEDVTAQNNRNELSDDVQGSFQDKHSRLSVLGENLREISLASNDIADSAAISIFRCLTLTSKLKSIDLSFNNLTSYVSFVNEAIFPTATSVTSLSSEDQKLLDLNVNLVGNPCGDYLLEYPHRARSKVTLRHGLTASRDDPYNAGYSHVDEAARKNYKQRTAAYLKHYE